MYIVRIYLTKTNNKTPKISMKIISIFDNESLSYEETSIRTLSALIVNSLKGLSGLKNNILWERVLYRHIVVAVFIPNYAHTLIVIISPLIDHYSKFYRRKLRI